MLTTHPSTTRIQSSRLAQGVRIAGLLFFVIFIIAIFLSFPFLQQSLVSFVTDYAARHQGQTDWNIAPQVFVWFNLIFSVLYALTLSIVALFIFLNRTDDWVAILTAIYLLAQASVPSFQSLPSSLLSNILLIFSTTASTLLIFVLLCLFPNGRFYPQWSRWLLLPYVLVTAIQLILVLGTHETRAAIVAYMLEVLFWCVGVFFQIRRLRQTTDHVQRQQLKLLLWGILVAVAASLINEGLPIIAPGLSSLQMIRYMLYTFLPLSGLIVLAFALMISILRYGLWNIDLVINRSLVYGGVVIGLAIIFFPVTILLDSVLQVVLGSEQTTIAAMVSTGLAAASFNPVRIRLQKFVDRRFFGLEIGLQKIEEIDRKQKAEKAATLGTGSLTGKTLGAYQLLQLIGRGGMGEVYLAQQSSLNRKVAVKLLPSDLALDSTFRARFEREARIVAQLHHPHIIQVFDYGEYDGIYYMVMEFIDGEDLSQVLRRQTQLTVEEALPLVTEVAKALDYLHSQGIVHRDIKPSNIMLRSTATSTIDPVLMDFGLLKLIGSNSNLTTSAAVGSLGYMSPEQITIARQVDHRADIYAFGVLCYQLLTGHVPFSSENPAQVLFAHLDQPPADPRLFCPELSPQVASAILQALEKRPENRPLSAGQFIEAWQSGLVEESHRNSP